MKSNSRNKSIRNRIIYTLVLAVLLSAVFLIAIGYVYNAEENHSLEALHVSTKEIREDIELQIHSDQENLMTIANFAADLYKNSKGYDIILESFKPIGLIENIGILTPDDTFITPHGVIENVEGLDFELESRKGNYISGRTKDVTHPDRYIVRSSVPIISENKVVGVLYGVVGLDTITNRYSSSPSLDNSKLLIFESKSGDYIVNTRDSKIDNLSGLANRKFADNYTYAALIGDIKSGTSGYSSFESEDGSQLYYVHYSPIDVGDWTILLAKPEAEVFAKARNIEKVLFVIFLLAIILMSVYLAIIFYSERRQSKLNLTSSGIRKLLLGINRNDDGVKEALERICNFAKARSAIYFDSDGVDYNYIVSELEARLLSGKARELFVKETMNISAKRHKESGAYVSVYRLNVDSSLNAVYPEYYDLLIKNDIHRMTLAAIASKDGHISILGTINSRKHAAIKMLLEEVSVCFSMAIYNRKHLNRTETIAVTDSLTGLSNRLAYKKDVQLFDKKMPENFSCIYVDVNELHTINNKYGHARGDSMLIYIANVLKETFNKSRVYRMGGDEFLVFTEGESEEKIQSLITDAVKRVEEKDYHISVGMSFSTHNLDAEILVKDAEKRMYEAKAQYYQQKDRKEFEEDLINGIEHISTGIRELDTLLAIMSHRYMGIYCVSLKSDLAKEILMPAYLKKFAEDDKSFSRIFSMYVHETVDSDYQRAMLSFLEYDIIKRELLAGEMPTISYAKSNGKKYRLTVYPLSGFDADNMETIWVFERE